MRNTRIRIFQKLKTNFVLKLEKVSLLLLLCIFISGCSAFKRTPKEEFIDDLYVQKKEGIKSKVYVDVDGEDIRIHPVKKLNNVLIVDSLEAVQVYPLERKGSISENAKFRKNSFDIDFITIPLKLRPATKNVSTQLNATLNGAIFLGIRKDEYVVKYRSSPLNKSERQVTHLGYSVGLFTGFGNTDISSTNTNHHTEEEYDGVVWNKGVAFFFAVNRFTVGLALGFDNLMDHNKKIWIYEGKPWIGIGLGLNLN